jgi:hypothetical protein
MTRTAGNAADIALLTERGMRGASLGYKTFRPYWARNCEHPGRTIISLSQSITSFRIGSERGDAYLEGETCTSGSRRASRDILPTLRFPSEGSLVC